MRIAVLTSSRADYGIYRPLLAKLKSDSRFELKLIVFGTHLSRFHGHTIDNIIEDGFNIEYKLETLILGDSESAVSNAMGNTITKFSSLWERLKPEVDLVIALGDRYEMFAAVSASVPFNIKIAHLHGGETTLGAIDDKLRHCITMMSNYHLTATKEYSDKVAKMIGSNSNVYHTGSLSLDNLISLNLLGVQEFKAKYDIDLGKPTILNTLHPETINPENNLYYAEQLAKIFDHVSSKYQIVITMPNADTNGSVIREVFQKLISKNSNVIGVESFGTLGYFSCIKHSSFLLGNTSSGLIEAPSMGKYAINVGDRQKGRSRSENVIDVACEFDEILQSIAKVEKLGSYNGSNVYKKDQSIVADEIINILNKIKN